MIQEKIVGVDHIALQVPDLDEGLRFFRDLLGFKTKFAVEFDGYQVVMLKAGKIEIEMWQGKTEGKGSVSDSDYGLHHLAILVKDVDAVMAHMKEIGVPILEDIYEPTRGIREAIVQGPGGARVQFVEQDIPLLIWRTIKGDI
jgi:catechol 2,3-dioxygenase-like lactoylglutathione lyase family enzyme